MRAAQEAWRKRPTRRPPPRAPQLADVFALFSFVMFVFGLTGLQLFMGELHWCANAAFRFTEAPP